MSPHIKDNIRAHFNRAVRTYDQHCIIQNVMCEEAIALLGPSQRHFQCIADMGCGTGESTIKLLENLSCERGYAIDFSENLLSVAKKKLSSYRKMDCIHADFDEKLGALPSLDLIFSNMALQWSAHLAETFRLFQHYLKEGALLLFSMPLADNFPEIKPAFKPVLPFHEAVLGLLREEGFAELIYQTEIFSLSFEDQLSLLRSLKNIGANYNKSQDSACQGFAKGDLGRIFIRSKNTQLTYKVGIYLARKNKP